MSILFKSDHHERKKLSKKKSHKLQKSNNVCINLIIKGQKDINFSEYIKRETGKNRNIKSLKKRRKVSLNPVNNNKTDLKQIYGQKKE